MMEKHNNRKLSDDLENWMKNLSDTAKALPVINLAIPGSHDSCSYGITRKSKPSPDAESAMATAYKFLPCVVKRWAKTQSYNLTNQLNLGVRYFDFRIGRNSKEDAYYFVHGLYCDDICKPLHELREFLISHPDEFVIVDCQHFYEFDHVDHLRLKETLTTIFKNMIFEKRSNNLLQCTLKTAIGQQKQILIIYRNSKNECGYFWHSDDWPTPWPNTVDIKKLKAILDKTLARRTPYTGFTSQVVLTPDERYIVPRFIFSLKSRLAKPLHKKMLSWVSEQQPGPFSEGETPKCNVFIVDFVDIKKGKFCKAVIDLNEKL